jgi:hypothetical protein
MARVANDLQTQLSAAAIQQDPEQRSLLQQALAELYRCVREVPCA